MITHKLKKFVQIILNNLPVPSRKFTVQAVTLSPNRLLNGRTAFITGGTSGIGYHIAKAFLNSGANVIITSRKKENLEKACSDLEQNGLFTNCVFGILMDNTDIKSFQKCFDDSLYLITKSGRSNHIDILVNNAGVLGAHFPNATEEQFDLVMDTNLKAAFFLSQLFGNYYKQNKIEGNILNIASSSALRPANSAYTISKWGIRGLTLGLAKSLTPYGITVNAIAPGPTATPMLIKENLNKVENSTNPIGRYALPEEIANMAVVVVSAMGKTIVGDVIYMTGGAGLITYDDIDYSF